DRARGAFDAGDAVGFLCSTDSHRGLQLVWDNVNVLREAGLYEPALLHAFTMTNSNHAHWPFDLIEAMFRLADREQLRAAGDPLPGPGPFTLCRGVAGHGRRRRLRGFSWTDDVFQAAWFATRFGLVHPVVLTVTVEADAVLSYVNDRQEREFVVA